MKEGIGTLGLSMILPEKPVPTFRDHAADNSEIGAYNGAIAQRLYHIATRFQRDERMALKVWNESGTNRARIADSD